MNLSLTDHLLKPVHKFIRQQHSGGIVLLISVLIALAWANSPWAVSYHSFWKTKYAVGFAGHVLNEPLQVWINDGLMTLFFFVVGLGLKREFMIGELSTAKKAALPMVAALGGMLVPALIYLAFNAGKTSETGWGIPMATDIAFALGILSLAGKHIPAPLKVFLSALAVADDLGAILVIAFFYTTHIAAVPLIAAGVLLLLLSAANAKGIRHPSFYLLAGVAVWLCFLVSGVHATIAGVLVAFTIPSRTKINELQPGTRTDATKIERDVPQEESLAAAEQQRIENIKNTAIAAETPLQKIEHTLQPWVTFIIMPLFALANAGITFSAGFFTALNNPVSIGVILGLIVGKFCGILLFSRIMVSSKWADLPEGTHWNHLAGAALLAGVGFTMSLFVTELAFDNALMIGQAKTGIFIASALAGLTGSLFLRKLRIAKSQSFSKQ
ncbi:MAG TPA: Na+/H+ antiporter NhaA [Chitinophagaceae bacterium]|nr:Na+/H+ antiporter NhaA [Chitinophagaceae bacterium]